MITRNREYMAEPVPIEMLRSVLIEYKKGRERRERLRKAYENQRCILDRAKLPDTPNNRLAHGFPRYIVTMAAGYLLGGPVTYTDAEQQEALEQVTAAYAAADAGSVDIELARQASIYGKAVELEYVDEQAQPRCAALDPESAFVVYDDTVAHKPMFGVSFSKRTKPDGSLEGYAVNVYTDANMYRYEAEAAENIQEPVSVEEHFFGAVPMVEFWNDENERGDFEQVESLIDAYDVLESDRVNDKEKFVDSLLVLTGARMENEYRTVTTTDANGNSITTQEISATPAQQLRRDKMLYLPDAEAKAEYLSRTMNEADVEVLRAALKADIHKFSFVPDLTDENFASNASGVAMRYKLLGLEQLTRIKEKWFREALRERLRRFAYFLGIKGGAALDANKVTMSFTRALPVNELETAQMVQTYSGLVPDSILLTQVPFVDDPAEAAEQMEEQKAKSVERQQQAFSGYSDIPE